MDHDCQKSCVFDAISKIDGRLYIDPAKCAGCGACIDAVSYTHLTSIHLGNAVCVLGALIMGGLYGGLGGAIGMTIGDLLDPVYIIYAPKTLSLIHI